MERQQASYSSDFDDCHEYDSQRKNVLAFNCHMPIGIRVDVRIDMLTAGNLGVLYALMSVLLLLIYALALCIIYAVMINAFHLHLLNN